MLQMSEVYLVLLSPSVQLSFPLAAYQASRNRPGAVCSKYSRIPIGQLGVGSELG